MEKIELLKTCKESVKWIKDGFTMMNTKGCGWTDASDSFRIALRTLETAIKKCSKKS